MCHRQRYWVTRNMDKPSKGKYAITNRTRQLLTVSFVALGSFLVFSGSKCNNTTAIQYVVITPGAGLRTVTRWATCALDDKEREIENYGRIYSGGTYYDLDISLLLSYGQLISTIDSSASWRSASPAQLDDNRLCSALLPAVYNYALYQCSFSPSTGPGATTMYNCGYNLNVTVNTYNFQGVPTQPPGYTTIFLYSLPKSGLPDHREFASITLTHSTTTLTIPTSMLQGAYVMKTTAEVTCGITNRYLPDNELHVNIMDSKGIDLKINCLVN